MNKDKILKIVKIASLSLVALAFIVELCVLLFGRDEKPSETPLKDPFDTFAESVSLDSLVSCKYTVSYTEAGVTLDGNYTATFSEKNGKREVSVTYSVERLAEIGESDEMIITDTGTLFASGEDEIKALFGDMGLPYGFFVKKEDFKNYEIKENTLSGSLADSALNEKTTYAVLSFKKDLDSGKLAEFDLTYTAENGSGVSVKCEFEYAK